MSWFGEAESCHDIKEKACSEHRDSTTRLERKSCCHNSTFTAQLSQDVVQANAEIQSESASLIAVLNEAKQPFYNSSTTIPSAYFEPPPNRRDPFSLYQVWQL